MERVICAWCQSTHTTQLPNQGNSKYIEYICTNCKHSTFHQTDFDFSKITSFSEENREFLMLEPEYFLKSNQPNTRSS